MGSDHKRTRGGAVQDFAASDASRVTVLPAPTPMAPMPNVPVSRSAPVLLPGPRALPQPKQAVTFNSPESKLQTSIAELEVQDLRCSRVRDF